MQVFRQSFCAEANFGQFWQRLQLRRFWPGGALSLDGLPPADWDGGGGEADDFLTGSVMVMLFGGG